MGVKAEGHNLVELGLSLGSQSGQTQGLTLDIGVLTVAFQF